MKMITKLKLILVFTAVGLSFLAGLQTRQPPKTVTKEIFVYVDRPINIPFKQTQLFKKQSYLLAAAIPAKALGGK